MFEVSRTWPYYYRLCKSKGDYLVEYEAVKEEEIEEGKKGYLAEEDEENQEEVKEEDDEGEILPLRRELSSQKSEKEEQRENNFHSRCIVQGKVCSLIIEGGS